MLHTLMVINTMEITLMGLDKVKGNIFLQMEISMRETLDQIVSTVLVNSHIKKKESTMVFF